MEAKSLTLLLIKAGLEDIASCANQMGLLREPQK